MPDNRIAGLHLDCTTPAGQRWSTAELRLHHTEVLDAAYLLSQGDLITILAPGTGRPLGVLEVHSRCGEFALLRRLRDS